MRAVDVHEHAEQDLIELLGLDRVAALRITAVIELMVGDEALNGLLLTHNADYRYANIKRWNDQYFTHKRNLWRISSLAPGSEVDRLPYRIIYAYFPKMGANLEPFFKILAVFYKNEFDYDDPGHPNTGRILQDYDSIIAGF